MDLGPMDPAYVADVLSRPPFVTVNGVHNIRDLGLYPSSFGVQVTKPNFIFRSAEISGITEEGASISGIKPPRHSFNYSSNSFVHISLGRDQMRALGITVIFDLRSDTEIEKYKTPLPEIDGVEVLRTPVFKWEDYSPEMMARRYRLYASGETDAFMELYSQILDSGRSAFGSILRHVRDRKTNACLIHCTAGKDRTGVIAAIILKLAGVSDEVIAGDYALTRIGREPLRDKVMARLSKEPLFASNNQAALNMFACRETTMLAFLSILKEKYGGVENYLSQYLGLSGEDIETIRTILLVPSTSLPWNAISLTNNQDLT